MNRSVAVVDSYDLIRVAFGQHLQKMGYKVVIEAADGVDFIQQLDSSNSPSVCILDIDTPDISEYDTAKLIKQYCPDIKIIAYTVYERIYTDISDFGIDLFIDKGCSVNTLKTHIKKLMAH